MEAIFEFLTDLRANNNREWFTGSRTRYEDIKKRIETVGENLLAMLSTVDDRVGALRLADCTYRINRDTRFSADKSPYKTHVGFFVCPPHGKKSLLSGYYLHLEPGASLICGGNYGLPSQLLRAVRKDIYDNIEEYLEIVESNEFKSLYPQIGEEQLKTAPKGFDKNWEYISYLRPKDFGVSAMLSDDFVKSPDLMERLRPYAVQAKRLNDFVNFAIEESGFEYRWR